MDCFVLQCNCDKRSLCYASIPSFYKQILFSQLKSLYDTNFGAGHDIVQQYLLSVRPCRAASLLYFARAISETVVIYKEILIEGKTFFLKSWFQKGIISIQDLLKDDGHLLSFQEFQHKYNVKSHFLQYFPSCFCNTKRTSGKSSRFQYR